MKLKYLIAILILSVVILFGYWIKCQTSANLSESVSLSNFIPFKYLQRNDVISVPEPGIILYDSFEKTHYQQLVKIMDERRRKGHSEL
jgi:predicted negative regulator of RcsB-dependent stress response